MNLIKCLHSKIGKLQEKSVDDRIVSHQVLGSFNDIENLSQK